MAGAAASDQRPLTVLESALRGDRAPAVVLLIVLPLVSWMWIVVMARDMYGPMTGASAWMMTAVWDVRHLALLWAMWAVMMVGMMLPSASPMLLLYGGVARRFRNRSIRSVASDLRVRGRLPGGVGLVQPRSNRAPASSGNASVRLADDGGHQSGRRRRAAADRRGVSADADQAGLPADVPVAPGISDEPVAQPGWLARSVWVSSTALFAWAAAGR